MLAAMDVGGTYIRGKIFDEKGALLNSETMPTQETGIVEAIERILEKYHVEKIGISFAGQVDHGVILSSPNIKVDETRIEEYFKKKYGVELLIENDLKCAALAEWEDWKCDTSLVAASIGTGFGAAIVERGGLVRGVKNMAGEIGHAPYRYSPIPCGCGNHYCIEASCSGAALLHWMEYYRLPITKDLLSSLNERNDPHAKEILERFHEGLLFAIASLISILNPTLLVLGGGVVQKNPYLLDLLHEKIARYALPAAVKEVEIVMSRLQDAPLKGAELLWKITD